MRCMCPIHTLMVMTSSQRDILDEMCHLFIYSMSFIFWNMSWYRKDIKFKDEVDVMASLANESTFSLSIIYV